MSGTAAQVATGIPAEKHTARPSDVVEPTQITTAPQQGSTQPGDGSTVRETTGPDGQPLRVIEVPGDEHQVPFKDQVIGYAKKTRGTMLNKPELKEHGEQIIQGTASVSTPPEHHS
ncbi:hypothetical protein E1B28_006686 [Marasmius oreades]|uniref:Uncharacterized protein n=1 Tax=Marasmius oreades TaxID=181124 RepID=A0A9P7UWN1_9AGAR|nr:uncharacterized protein E1B28_006686 [Marasmius oreades]KAG7096004.1 hypothetical protein E1B28_006686 [Marasmius oreades]